MKTYYAGSVTPVPKDGNVANMTFSSDPLNHDLLGYIAAYPSNFTEAFGLMKNNITQPNPGFTTGYIRATVFWDVAQGVQLHVY